MAYAEETTVSASSSLDEIRRILKRYNATNFVIAEDDYRVVVGFQMRKRRVRFTLPLPQADDEAFIEQKGNRYYKKGEYLAKEYEQAVRQRWRALTLTIKAKLESVESGIETFEDAFMAQLILASGQTMGEWAKPQVEQLYGGNQAMPPLLVERIPEIG